MHAATTFQLLDKQECDILCNMSKEERKDIRSRIIDAILATDMTFHFEIFSQMQGRNKDVQNGGQKRGENTSDATLIIKVLLHAMDLGNVVCPWEIC